MDTVQNDERLTMIRSYPSHPSKFIVVRMVIEVDAGILKDTLNGEDTGKPLTTKQLVKVMEREMEKIKRFHFGIHPVLPNWFNAVDCAEIEETK
jgi:hypothetical protein